MTHIIISAVLVLTFAAALYVLDNQTKIWQIFHEKEIRQYKREMGENYTLFPEGYHKTLRVLSLLFLGSSVYLVIAVLLYFFT